MITPELLGYIRSELAKGKTREEIHTTLIHGGGWKDEDLEEAFREVLPPPPQPVVPPVPQAPQQPQPLQMPEIPQGLPIEQPMVMQQPVQPQPVVPVVMEPAPEKHVRYYFRTFLLGIVSVVIALATLALNKIAFALISFAVGLQFIIPIVIVLIAIIILVSALLLHLATKVFKSVQSSWPKALFATSSMIAIGMAFTMIESLVKLPVLLLILMTIVIYGLDLFILTEVYKTSLLKSFLLSLVQALFTGIFFGILFGLITAVVTHSNTNQQPQVTNYGTTATFVPNTAR